MKRLTPIPKFQTDLDWNESRRNFEKETEDFFQKSRLNEDYDTKRYHENGWDVTEVSDEQSIVRIKTKRREGERLKVTEYVKDGKKVYHSQKIEGDSYNVIDDSGTCGGCCLGVFLIGSCIIIIIILEVIGLIGMI